MNENAPENGLIDLAQRLGSHSSKALWTLKLAQELTEMRKETLHNACKIIRKNKVWNDKRPKVS